MKHSGLSSVIPAMARIAHLSDIHFGANNPEIVSATLAWLDDHRPDLVVISGDLTQRAREKQFAAAADYIGNIKAIGLPVLVVPGNHDVPLYDVFRRFLAPLERYKRHIGEELCPFFENDEVAVLGINTARSLTFSDGRINREQMDLIRSRFGDVAKNKTRILVTHHPIFRIPIGEGGELAEAVGRHEDAVAAMTDAGVHIALAGHYHQTYAEAASKMVETAGGALVIQAGTATSTRLRNDEPQSFNWLHVGSHDDIEMQVIFWDGTVFRRGNETRFDHKDGGWEITKLSNPASLAKLETVKENAG